MPTRGCAVAWRPRLPRAVLFRPVGAFFGKIMIGHKTGFEKRPQSGRQITAQGKRGRQATAQPWAVFFRAFGAFAAAWLARESLTKQHGIRGRKAVDRL